VPTGTDDAGLRPVLPIGTVPIVTEDAGEMCANSQVRFGTDAIFDGAARIDKLPLAA
jgi:hypothetical protein